MGKTLTQNSYPTIITDKINEYQALLLKEHRGWRAIEIQNTIHGLTEALSLYYAHGFQSSTQTTRNKE